jgi:hypothetical protein
MRYAVAQAFSSDVFDHHAHVDLEYPPAFDAGDRPSMRETRSHRTGTIAAPESKRKPSGNLLIAFAVERKNRIDPNAVARPSACSEAFTH